MLIGRTNRARTLAGLARRERLVDPAPLLLDPMRGRSARQRTVTFGSIDKPLGVKCQLAQLLLDAAEIITARRRPLNRKVQSARDNHEVGRLDSKEFLDNCVRQS